ncbi:Protein CBG26578 [Caenorhabditis briggsae]|uniref:Protein CBG26578 n=1 Tax=Caenorhabditis briggsae TaxID=6238 RepID=B6IFQ7_CAEBR|nr:Protein CBG26578 [Caenorhabditis briggsae]CAR98737.1 Protein CBG26578 [Caenorhabditis briggsae]
MRQISLESCQNSTKRSRLQCSKFRKHCAKMLNFFRNVQKCSKNAPDKDRATFWTLQSFRSAPNDVSIVPKCSKTLQKPPRSDYGRLEGLIGPWRSVHGLSRGKKPVRMVQKCSNSSKMHQTTIQQPSGLQSYRNASNAPKCPYSNRLLLLPNASQLDKCVLIVLSQHPPPQKNSTKSIFSPFFANFFCF